jgi:ATP-dependent protease HslVU (ClpYQ) peptidase subunit
VIGYNYNGAWTAVTYNRSSTPKGGAHYHLAARACTFALRDLYARASDDLARTEIVSQSDKTGYVAVAQGKAVTRNKDVTAIGRGRSQSEADGKALKKLNDREATTDEQIVYRYFSYGAESTVLPRTRRAARAKASRRASA